MGQVLDLGEFLRDRVDLFTFNRLSQTGEGATLETAAREEYKGFLQNYLKAVKSNPTMGVKKSTY